MTPRTFLSVFLLALIFPAREIWQLWKTADREVNWFLIIDYPLSIQWYFKFLGAQISEFLMALVIYRITYKIQALRMAAVVVLIYSLDNDWDGVIVGYLLESYCTKYCTTIF
jgi:hypothetical protein